MKKFLSLSALFLSLAAAVFPLSGTAESGSRVSMNEAARREILNLAKDEVPQDQIGDWKESLDSAVFTLFRRTELHRGRIRLLVVRSPSVSIDLYPDGTLLVSTGLLDCVDERLFLKAEGSSRRIRDFGAERELALVPFLALQASRHALDRDYIDWSGRTGAKPEGSSSTDSAAFQADRAAAVIMTLAGFKTDLLSSWLSDLSDEQKNGTLNPNISSWLSTFPPTDRRFAAIQRDNDTIQKTAAAFAGILESLRTSTGLRESAASIAALRERGYGSMYLDRLEALTLHRLWLSGVPAGTQMLMTFFPVADDLDPSRRDFLPFSKQAGAGITSSSIPGDPVIFLKAIEAYRNALDACPEPGLASSYARLLVHAGNAESRGHALSLAGEAARAEEGSTSRVARENCLAVLYLTGNDPARTAALAAGSNAEPAQSSIHILIADDESGPSPVNVPEGFPGDSRNFELNRIIMGLAASAAAAERSAITELSLRKVRIGDSVDAVVEAWGKPAQITYNYYSETWDYPAFAASVNIVDDSADGHRVRLIWIGSGSPVSPGRDIRTGGRRALFESEFGKPAWRAGDGYVYTVGENLLKVIYYGDRIRSFAASGAER